MHVHNMGTPATSRPAQKSDSAAPQPAQAMPEFNDEITEIFWGMVKISCLIGNILEKNSTVFAFFLV